VTRAQNSVARPSLAWIVLSLALAAAFLTINRQTSMSAPPWVDEVMQIDAGLNLAMGKGWVSSAWFSQSVHEFWAANNPLYTLLGSAWIRIVGLDPVAVRTLNLLLALAAAWLIVSTSRRTGLVRTAAASLALALLVLTDGSVSYIYRTGRADLVPLLVVVLLWRAITLEQGTRGREALLFSFAALVPASGLHIIPYIAALLVLELAITRRRRTRDLWVMAAGCMAGGLALMGIFLVQGVLRSYLAQTVASGYNILGAALQAVVIRDHAAVRRFIDQLAALLPWNFVRILARDASSLPLIAFLLASIFAARGERRWSLRSPAVAGVVAAVLIPLAMLAAGRYMVYYGWMGALPVAVAFAVVLDRDAREGRWGWWRAGVATGALALLLGMPLQIWQQVRHTKPSQYAEIERIVDEATRPGDVVYGDPVLYYAAKSRSLEFFSTSYAGGHGYPHMSEDERARFTAILVPPAVAKEAQEKVGGAWVRSAIYPSPYGSFLVLWRRAPIGPSGE